MGALPRQRGLNRLQVRRSDSIRQLQPDLYQIRNPLVCCHAILDRQEVHLIDAGFVGDLKKIHKLLKDLGLSWANVKTVLLTHGHLDHTYNIAQIQKRSAAVLYAHSNEREHISGKHTYKGSARACGFLEACGRFILGYQAPRIDYELLPDQILPLAGGIKVVHTPGHTQGHCSFLWEKHSLLFSGDLFATGKHRTFLPPRFLNSCPEKLPSSIDKLGNLHLSGMLSNHCDSASPALQLSRFQRFREPPKRR